MSASWDTQSEPVCRRLTKQEIDRRITDLASELAAGATQGDAGSSVHDSDDLRPRWITAAELVRRMRCFMVYN